MEFALTSDQALLQDSLNGYLASDVPLDRVREYAAGDKAQAQKAQQGLVDLGLPGILIPEEQDGVGLGLLDAALVQESLGFAVAPAGFLANAGMAVTAILYGGDQTQIDEYLPKIASGEIRMGVALNEAVSIRENVGVSASGGKLNGRSLFALECEQATHILVCDTNRALHILEATAAGLIRKPLQTIDTTRDFSELVFENVSAVSLSGPVTATDRAIETGRLLLAADSLGAAQCMLNQAVDYAKERKQFNRVIGSFQSVKHLCAEMAASIEPARALIWHAAHARDENMEEGEVMICLAKSHLAEIGTFVARTSTEVHGGMGFTDLVGLHYWFKRIGMNRQLLGSPEAVREHAARLQGWVS